MFRPSRYSLHDKIDVMTYQKLCGGYKGLRSFQKLLIRAYDIITPKIHLCELSRSYMRACNWPWYESISRWMAGSLWRLQRPESFLLRAYDIKTPRIRLYELFRSFKYVVLRFQKKNWWGAMFLKSFFWPAIKTKNKRAKKSQNHFVQF